MKMPCLLWFRRKSECVRASPCGKRCDAMRCRDSRIGTKSDYSHFGDPTNPKLLPLLPPPRCPPPRPHQQNFNFTSSKRRPARAARQGSRGDRACVVQEGHRALAPQEISSSVRRSTSKGRKRACGDNPMMNAAPEEGSDDGKEMMVSLRAAPGAAGGSEKRENFNNYAEVRRVTA